MLQISRRGAMEKEGEAKMACVCDGCSLSFGHDDISVVCSKFSGLRAHKVPRSCKLKKEEDRGKAPEENERNTIDFRLGRLFVESRKLVNSSRKTITEYQKQVRKFCFMLIKFYFVGDPTTFIMRNMQMLDFWKQVCEEAVEGSLGSGPHSTFWSLNLCMWATSVQSAKRLTFVQMNLARRIAVQILKMRQ